MLVLTRKLGQKLIINENIEVVILETKGESVKIGIKAPKNVTIYREEIYEEIKKANAQASKNVQVNDLNSVLNMFDSQNLSNANYLDKIKKLSNNPEK
ncbi:MAG: carbon storage regulator CsrA [bacterium]